MTELTGGYFSHERLDVYRVGLEFLRWTAGIEAELKGRAWLKDQLFRAASSVVLNVAEGASQESRGAARRHFRIAMASAGECAAALDVAEAFGIRVEAGRPLVRRVGAMLRRLSR